MDSQATTLEPRLEGAAPGPRTASAAAFEFLSFLGRNPFGETWKARAADGRLKVVHFLESSAAREHAQGIDQLLSLAHPAVPAWEYVCCDLNRLALAADFFEPSLRDRFQQCWATGMPGVPQTELLECLRAAAEALDTLCINQRIQHLALAPEHLRARPGEGLLAHFGLAQLLWQPAGVAADVINPRYAAPELRRGRHSFRCDQYSLALIYAEMRTGVHPLRGRGRGRAEPAAGDGTLELHLLSEAERQVVARALHDQSHERFTCCTDFVQALDDAVRREPEAPAGRAALPSVIVAAEGGGEVIHSAEFLRALNACLMGEVQVRQDEQVRYRLGPGVSLEHRCAVGPSVARVLQGLETFRGHWEGRILEHKENRVVLSVPIAAALWRRLLGRRPRLTVQVLPIFLDASGKGLGEVLVTVRPVGCGGDRALRLLEDVGPTLLEDLRSCLGALPEHRHQERFRCDRLLRVTPILTDLKQAEPLDGVGKDISVGGIGFFLRRQLPSPDVYVNLPWLPELAGQALRAQVVRGRPRGDGWYEIGAMFPAKEA